MPMQALRCGCGHNPLHCIIPPYMLETMAESADAAVRKTAVAAIEVSAQARTLRSAMQELPALAALMSPNGKKNRQVYDGQHMGQSSMPGVLVRGEGQPKVADVAVNEAYDHSGRTYDFFNTVFARNSLDGNGMTLVSSVHLGHDINNAFWNGRQMMYGDGDGRAFLRFTRSLDVVGHELTHGVIAHECNLRYMGQSGALNEHFADVFGILVRQWRLKQSANKADWLIGRELLGPAATRARGLRDFGPGKAYEDDPAIGTDPQPKHMASLYTGSGDFGGVHINSGIPNHAFYLFARSLGGPAWQLPGAIWYEAMRKLSATSDFADMVSTTLMIASAQHGAGSTVHKALQDAWKAVGL